MSFAALSWPRALPIGSALLLWCAFPGGGELWPLLFVALMPLLVALPRLSPAGAGIAGLVTGLAHYLLQLYWIVIVLGRYGGLPTVVSVPALVLLAGYMAVYFAVLAAGARRFLADVPPLLALLAIPSLWVGLDWLRGWLFSGFPWMDLGYGLAGVPLLIQAADIFGHWTITFLVVLVNTVFALVILERRALRRLLPSVLVAVTVLAATAVYSLVRWQDVLTRLVSPSTPSMTVGIAQGNIDQSAKWSPDNQQRTLNLYIELTRALSGKSQPELVVWPETALPFYPQTYPNMAPLAELISGHDIALLTGAPWFEREGDAAKSIVYYNSAQLLVPGGRYAGSYHKSHLVPFGEYVPMKKLLPFLAPLVEAVGDFSPGEVAEPLVWKSARIGVLICFESIFPDIARKWCELGANVLVNLTNDAWYGKSSAPYHSMAMTVFRALETRRSVVRSANTGISGIIDPLGRVENPSPIFVTWAETGRVWLLTEKTFFVRWGYRFPAFCLAIGIGSWFVAGRSRRLPTNR